MSTLWLIALLMLLLTTSEAKPALSTVLISMSTVETSPIVMQTSNTLRVFEIGSLETTTITAPTSDSSAPPHPLFIVSPKTAGVYPIIFYVHGTYLQNYDYSDLFLHIASHGYVVVAPQLWSNIFLPSQVEEIEMAASVINWLPLKLETLLPIDVTGDLSKLAVSGHSRGGKTAFALALGMSQTKPDLNVSALIGVDPVAGTSKENRKEPHVLSYIPNSFNLSIPTMVIGTGLGNRSIIPFGPACAPNEVNHDEFYYECRHYCAHFVVTEYGHMDMLNDNLSIAGSLARAACVQGKGQKDPIRRTIGGLIVAYLDSCFHGESSEYVDIINNPSLAPAKVYPIDIKNLGDDERYYS